MIFITSERQNYCPNCGEKAGNNSDFHAGAAEICDCGAQSQYVPQQDILTASEPHGDLSNYN